MKAAKERNELLAPRGMHGELQSCLDSFSAAVGEMSPRRSRDGHDLVELLGQFRHALVVIIGAAHVNQLGGLVLNRAYDFRMAMPGRTDRNPGVTVQKNVAINVFDPDAGGALGYQLE